ncbi:4016_t:CDS:2 [Paraglomus brasilianum]|uniref:4016_t:CDS:1 n=1 Tax=Paraglomus brasilianum TaxID=144538 RepID=A0A9N9FPZ5_9GLOM|nr:4016_t:CDS:2 [Paraglomus brasilianum]
MPIIFAQSLSLYALVAGQQYFDRTTLSLGKYEPRGPNSALFALTLVFAVDVAFIALNGKDLRLLTFQGI